MEKLWLWFVLGDSVLLQGSTNRNVDRKEEVPLYIISTRPASLHLLFCSSCVLKEHLNFVPAHFFTTVHLSCSYCTFFLLNIKIEYQVSLLFTLNLVTRVWSGIRKTVNVWFVLGDPMRLLKAKIPELANRWNACLQEGRLRSDEEFANRINHTPWTQVSFVEAGRWG